METEFTVDPPIQTVMDDPVFDDYGRLLFPVDTGYWRVMKARLDALLALGIDTEFHVHAGLGYSFGLGTDTSVERWLDLAVRFWERQM